ncbi:MAG: T9SS type A sorting domain-containing protein [Saprospiraceae bacterium]
MRLFSTTLVALLFSQMLLAQDQPHPVTNPGGCGTVGHTSWLNWYRQNKGLLSDDMARGSDSTWLYVPVTVHLIGRNSGTGQFRMEDAIRAICEMNAQYKPAYIQFYLHPGEPVVYTNNSEWFEHDWDGGSDMINSGNAGREDRLNAYVVDDPAGNCGYSWQDAIVLAKNCSGSGNTTWAHEAGHHFSLPHPFLGWEGTNWQPGSPAPAQVSWNEVEKLDGSNCHEAGDYFCDTRPDYLSYRWSCDDNRESIVLLTDPNGETFRADATIIMGYALDACASRFSDEQIEAMRTNLYTDHNAYLVAAEEGPMLDDNTLVRLLSPVDSQTVQYNNLTLNWEPVAGADIYIVEVGLLSNFQVVLAHKAITDGSTSVKISGGIPNNRLLYWRVKAYSYWDVCQPQGATQTGVFKTINLSATNELERVASVELLPNPVFGGGVAQLSIETSESLEGQVLMSDAAGRTVSARAVRLNFGSNLLDIPTNELSPGMYQVALQTEKGLVVKRLSVID